MHIVIKRDGSRQSFDSQKIINAIKAAGATQWSAEQIAQVIKEENYDEGEVEKIQDLIETELMRIGLEDVAKRYILYRYKREKVRLQRKDPDPQAVSDYIFYSKYSRYIENEKRRETWGETVKRLQDMHIRKYPHLRDEIQQAFEYVYKKQVLPSMRSLQFGGKAIEANNARMYNCSFSLCDRPRFFSELFFLLLSGCGVGYSVQRQHVLKLPKLRSPDQSRIYHHVVGDSIEAWAHALKLLIDSYTCSSFTKYVEFDYFGIRPQGASLKTSGGKAPGHVSLKIMLERVRACLDKAVGRHLKPIEAHDICCHIAIAVLAGGIRRSSLISLFSHDDGEMLEAKTGDWFKQNPQRAMANNSAVFLRHDTENEQQFKALFLNMKEFGEPGFFFSNHADYGCNPCGEIGLYPVEGEVTGFSFCNLTEINGSNVSTPTEFQERARVAAFIGTLQAGYTDFPYLTEMSSLIAERDALLGVSITGIMDNSIVRNPVHQRAAHAVVYETNLKVSQKIGIMRAQRLTTVKPSGTASLLLGCIGSGHHSHHARRYFRRVTANPLEPIFQHFKKINPHMCEQKPNGDWVITFPVKAPDSALLVAEMPAKKFMDAIFSTYNNWIDPNQDAYTISGQHVLTHNVSCTVAVKDDEWDEVAEYAWKRRHDIAAMSFLPMVGDKIYPYAPREAVITEVDEAKWNALIQNYRPVQYHLLKEGQDNTNPLDTNACETESCEV